MWKFWKEWFQVIRGKRSKTWNNRKIAFVGILIATSVAFVLIFSTIAPIVAMPTFKVAAGGLPVKLTGYIFGPIIGAVTGIISDLISFALRPFNIHFYYTIAFALAGVIPGIVGYFMNRRWKYSSVDQPPIDKEKYNYVNLAITLLILTIAMSVIVIFTLLQPQSVFDDNKFVHDKYIFLGIILGGSGSLFLGVFLFRIIFKPETFNAILPIIVFSALLELTNTPLVSLGDHATLAGNEKGSFITILTGHFLLSPIKAWGNLIIIFIAYKIVSPLIYSKTSNGWENETKTIEIKNKNIPETHNKKAANISKGRKK